MLSLIIATLGRVTELDRLLASLDRQTYKDFEVIVVDQNLDDRLLPLLREHKRLSIHRLRSSAGLSRARNAGMRAAKGDIFCFPDDDCWYPDQLLAIVSEWFEMHREFDGLFTSARTAANKIMAPKWAPGPCSCTKNNIWHCAMSITAFLRVRVINEVRFFNEDLGQGATTRYQSGEDSDYFIRALKLGFRIWYEPSFTVYHPELQSIERLKTTSYSYALGVGYVLRLHKYSWWYLAKLLMRSFGAALLWLCKGKVSKCHLCVLRGMGQFAGYLSGL